MLCGGMKKMGGEMEIKFGIKLAKHFGGRSFLGNRVAKFLEVGFVKNFFWGGVSEIV